MDINELRAQIDETDSVLLDAFSRRMDVSAQLAVYKKENNIPVYDPARERRKLSDILSKTPEELRTYASSLYSLLFDLSRSYQENILNPEAPLIRDITGAIDSTNRLFPRDAVVACQGIEGAYSQLACEKLFAVPNIMYCTTFESVFSAIDSGLCKYGVLPLENSTAGSINKIYDLMMKYRFYIVRSTRLKIDHNLLVKKGASLKDIKEVYSHEQAITQCGAFLKSLTGVKLTSCENTAMAAQMVADSPRSDVAALSSRYCADLYGLDCLADSVQDKGNNYTRFITISKDLEIYPGADKTSIMLSIPHKPGSLYRILARFYALGINLIKLESRPIPDRDFEFMFYFDLETPVYSSEFIQLMNELSGICEEFRYLGSYSEIV
ncbi:MAG: bifunctional chorismate mutase/prephenate dehydratase [Clostridiales bacterium]|nr:bifunctional chorismate mutase/prephenate dehydratase [Clostridiales bacterium]